MYVIYIMYIYKVQCIMCINICRSVVYIGYRPPYCNIYSILHIAQIGTLTQDSPAASVCTEGDSCEISPLPSALTAATE